MAGGTTLSAFWIVVLNSWMHTPAGFEMRDGVAPATNWWAIVYNPSLPYRLTHMMPASGLTVAFLIAGVSAYRWRRGDRGSEVGLTMRTGVTAAALLIPLQIVIGDLHGLNTLEHEPAKIAAIEAIWQTQKGAPMTLIGLPDATTGTTRFAIEVPKLASLALMHKLDGEVKGLDAFAGKHPPVAPLSFSFRLMIGIGLLMLAVSRVGWWQLRPNSGRPEPSPVLTAVLLAMTFLAVGVVAISAATPLVSPAIFDRWFTLPYGVLLAPLPLATLLLFFIVERSLRRLPTRLVRSNAYGDWLPFAGAVGIVMLAFYGLAYSLFPWLVVDRLTIWQAASSNESLWIIFVGACVVLPVIVGYTVFSCRVFQGKATALEY